MLGFAYMIHQSWFLAPIFYVSNRKQQDGKSVASAKIQAKKKRDAEFNSADITALGKRPKLEDFSTDDLK